MGLRLRILMQDILRESKKGGKTKIFFCLLNAKCSLLDSSWSVLIYFFCCVLYRRYLDSCSCRQS